MWGWREVRPSGRPTSPGSGSRRPAGWAVPAGPSVRRTGSRAQGTGGLAGVQTLWMRCVAVDG